MNSPSISPFKLNNFYFNQWELEEDMTCSEILSRINQQDQFQPYARQTPQRAVKWETLGTRLRQTVQLAGTETSLWVNTRSRESDAWPCLYVVAVRCFFLLCTRGNSSLCLQEAKTWNIFQATVQFSCGNYVLLLRKQQGTDLYRLTRRGSFFKETGDKLLGSYL